MALTVNLLDQKGTSVGDVALAPEVFEAPVNKAVMHQALVRQLANARQGTHDTKTRTEVRGGGRKPWRQKGTGRARQGSIRAPHWAGGGTVFGPHPRSYRMDMPRKMRRLALRSALSAQARDGLISVIEKWEITQPSTRSVASFLASIKAGARVLIVLGSHDEMLEKSCRNIPHVRVVLASNLSVRDSLTATTLVMTRDALTHLSEVLA